MAEDPPRGDSTKINQAPPQRERGPTYLDRIFELGSDESIPGEAMKIFGNSPAREFLNVRGAQSYNNARLDLAEAYYAYVKREKQEGKTPERSVEKALPYLYRQFKSKREWFVNSIISATPEPAKDSPEHYGWKNQKESIEKLFTDDENTLARLAEIDVPAEPRTPQNEASIQPASQEKSPETISEDVIKNGPESTPELKHYFEIAEKERGDFTTARIAYLHAIKEGDTPKNLEALKQAYRHSSDAFQNKLREIHAAETAPTVSSEEFQENLQKVFVAEENKNLDRFIAEYARPSPSPQAIQEEIPTLASDSKSETPFGKLEIGRLHQERDAYPFGHPDESLVSLHHPKPEELEAVTGRLKPEFIPKEQEADDSEREPQTLHEAAARVPGNEISDSGETLPFGEGEAERTPRNMSIDAVMIALSGPGKEWHTYSEFKAARTAYARYLGRFEHHANQKGKERQLGKEGSKLREAYIEARNSLLFSIASRMRPGAGFVPTRGERERDPNRRWITFTTAGVLNAFVTEEGNNITDSSFDGIAGMLREPELVEAFGPAALETYTGESRPVLEQMLDSGMSASGADPEALKEFEESRLAYLCALERKNQKSIDGRSADFRRTWLERNDPYFSFNRGRYGFVDRYEKALRVLAKTANARDLGEYRRSMQQLRNLMWRQRLDVVKRGVVQPLEGVLKKKKSISEWLLGAARRAGLRFAPRVEVQEEAAEVDEEETPEPETREQTREDIGISTYEIPEGQDPAEAIRAWLENSNMPEGVRTRLISGAGINAERSDPAAIAFAIALRYGLIGRDREADLTGARFAFNEDAEHPGFWVFQPDRPEPNRREQQLSDRNGELLNRFVMTQQP